MGPPPTPIGCVQRLEAFDIRVREERVVRLEGREGRLDRIVFAGRCARRTAERSSSPPASARLPTSRPGSAAVFTEDGAVDTGKCEATNVPGLYVCGDASREAQFVVVAAAEGAEAGMAINKALLEEELASD